MSDPITITFKGPGVPGFSGFGDLCDGPDHIYENCPNLKRKKGGGFPLSMLLYPLDDPYGDICGWCKRVWRSRTELGAE